ncbi:CD109 antigen-like [Pelobates fuscus]|uniref:CD109 antigen-like n=1 Tax=Pelobates fuscus TaxID=191477 RepID=UPI002FE4F4FD
MDLLKPPLVRYIFLVTCILYQSNAQPSYYISVPDQIFPGLNTTIAVHLFGLNYLEVNVTARLFDTWAELAHASSIFYNDSIGLLTLPALNSPLSSYYQVLIEGSSNNTNIFYQRFYLRKQVTPVHIFIQTDNIFYKPGQAVKIRVISVYHDLRPYNGYVDLVVRDPENNIIQKWQNLTNDLGVVSTEFLLSFNPMLDNWTIEATANSSQISAHFIVTNGDSPKFDVKLDVPTFYVYRNYANLTGKVTAKDIFGKPINGNVTISIKPLDDYYYGIAVNKTYETESGSANFSFTHEEIRSVYWYWYYGICLNALVTDTLTGTAMKASSYITVTDGEYRFIMISEPQSPLPDFNYTVKIQVLRHDGRPLLKEERDQNITVTIYQYHHWWWLRSGLRTGDNLTSFAQQEIEDNFTSHTTVDTESYVTSTTPVSYNDIVEKKQFTIPESGIVSFEFPVMQRFWQIHIEVGVPFQVRVNTRRKVQELYYVVMAKGGAVAAGKIPDALFTLTPERSWTPSATLIIYLFNFNCHYYYYYQIMKTSEILYIKDIFENTISLSWSKNKVQPGENVSLTVNVGETRSLVGLKVAEKTLQKNENDLTASRYDFLGSYIKQEES